MQDRKSAHAYQALGSSSIPPSPTIASSPNLRGWQPPSPSSHLPSRYQNLFALLSRRWLSILLVCAASGFFYTLSHSPSVHGQVLAGNATGQGDADLSSWRVVGGNWVKGTKDRLKDSWGQWRDPMAEAASRGEGRKKDWRLGPPSAVEGEQSSPTVAPTVKVPTSAKAQKGSTANEKDFDIEQALKDLDAKTGAKPIPIQELGKQSPASPIKIDDGALDDDADSDLDSDLPTEDEDEDQDSVVVVKSSPKKGINSLFDGDDFGDETITTGEKTTSWPEPEWDANYRHRQPGPTALSSGTLDEPCPFDSPCSFIFPSRVAEQESKSTAHLYSLGMLALQLNRTLVLPNAAKSTFSACFTRPFSFFYDATFYRSLGLPTIEQSEFEAWMDRRNGTTIAQQMVMEFAPRSAPQEKFEVDEETDWEYPSRLVCFEEKLPFSFVDHAELSFAYLNKRGDYRSRYLKEMVFGLRDGIGSATKTPPEVLVVSYNLRRPLFSPKVFNDFATPSIKEPLPFTHLPYSPTWLNVTKEVVARLQPFIGVQWRQETTPVQNLAPCAETLLDMIRAAKKKYAEEGRGEAKVVYISSDYPLEWLEEGEVGEPETHSSTYVTDLTETHHKAMRKLLKGLKALEKEEGLRFTTLVMEEERQGFTTPLPEKNDMGLPARLRDMDTSILGMVDREISVLSNVFISGQTALDLVAAKKDPHICARSSSSYAKGIIDERTRLRGIDGPEREMMWNTVERIVMDESKLVGKRSQRWKKHKRLV